jgi:hypothetical protein
MTLIRIAEIRRFARKIGSTPSRNAPRILDPSFRRRNEFNVQSGIGDLTHGTNWGPTERQNGNRQRNRGIQNFAPIFPVLPNHPLYRSEVFGILHKSLISKSSVGGILLTTQFIAGNYSCRSTAKK